MNTDICLVHMPYSSLTHPSLALGLIESYLAPLGHQVDTVYGNLEFAAAIGVAQYDFVDSTYQEHLIGEWTFSRAAFEDKTPNDSGFFALFSDMPDDTRARLLTIRSQAEDFINDIANRILAKQPKIVGCTSTFQQNCASLALLRKIKAVNPEIITIMGGANCEGMMGQTISKAFTWVDYVFSGECDEVIGDFISRLLKGVKFDLHNLPSGVIARNLHSIVNPNKKAQPPRAFVSDMSNVGTPVYDSYFDAVKTLGLTEHISAVLLVETSRGCWWGAKQHCTFCGLNGHSMTHRSKQPEAVMAELALLSSKHSLNKFEVVDNILPVEYMKTVLPRLAEAQNYAIFYETKANLRKHQVELIAKAGISWIQPGFESLHDDFLKLIRKGTTAVQNIAALKWCRTFGVRVSWNILCDAPGEQEQWFIEMAQWLPSIEHLQPPLETLVNINYPRFSPYFNQPSDYGLSLAPLTSYQFIYPLSGQDLFDIAYFFEDKNSQKGDGYSFTQPFHSARHGHQVLQAKILEWHKIWINSGPPLLYMVDHKTSIVLFDSRQVKTRNVHELTGLQATIYRLCEEPVSRSRLLTKLNASGEQVDEAALDDLMQPLLDNKLTLYISKCYLSLALFGDIPELPNVKDYPAGYLREVD